MNKATFSKLHELFISLYIYIKLNFTITREINSRKFFSW